MNDNKIVSNIKTLALDMINNAGSGHPGIVLSSAPILYALYSNHLNINPIDVNWFNRDRFVMSAGHGSAVLYSTLFMCGISFNIDDLKQFRRANSLTPGHPEVSTPGVEASTGPLGQGIGTAVGIALGEKILHERYKINSKESLIDYKVYVLVGDGDLMEGISYEASSLAGTLNLDNLIILYDSNNVTLDGNTSMSFKENVRERFESFGFSTYLVKDGSNISEINKAISKAKTAGKPAFIEIKTIIGKGIEGEGTNKVHGGVVPPCEVSNLKTKLGIPDTPFYYDQELIEVERKKIGSRVDEKYKKSTIEYRNYIDNCGGDKTLAHYMFNNEFNYDLLDVNFNIDSNKKEATRDSNKVFMEYLAKNIKTFVGGSCDLGSTTKTYLDSFSDITSNDFSGNNIWFGIREHAMGAILNGLALTNLKPYGSTFLSFSDYLKPALRMSALMKLPVTYIFTHDSILIGQDGPTHQPIEQLSQLRSIPGMKVFRPSDIKELQACWHVILNSNHNPSSLILSRTEVEQHTNTNTRYACNGGYIYYKEKEELEYILVATGTELSYARNIGYELIQKGYNNVRIVSMPCIEEFLTKPKDYRDLVLPRNKKVIVIEAGSSFGWHRIYNDKIYYITVEDFGISGTKDEVLKYTKFDYETVKNKIFNIISNNE